jgi:hypothetical protein
MEPSEHASSLERRNREDLEREQRFRRIRTVIFVLTGAAIVIFCIFTGYQYINGTYNDYTVSKETEKADAGAVNYISYKNKLLKYSQDGASLIDSDGKAVWNGSYDMKSPSVSISGNYIAIADIGGKTIYVYNGEDSGTEIKVVNSIVQIDVSSQGIVAVAMENNDSSLIDIYDPYQSGDTLRVEIPTSVNEDGFPVDIALSEDGQKLVTGFINIADGVMENKVTFYNFDEVGQNDINRQTGMINLEETLLSKVDFLNNNTVCIYTENGFSLYSMKEKQEKIADITFEETIKSVVSTDQYVGAVLAEYSDTEKYRLMIYNLKGKKVLEKELDFDYDKVQMTKKEIIFTSDLECNIIRLNGRKKFQKTFDQSVTAFLPLDDNKKYYLVGEYSIQEIQLKKN